jgi:hypothetical protein
MIRSTKQQPRRAGFCNHTLLRLYVQAAAVLAALSVFAPPISTAVAAGCNPYQGGIVCYSSDTFSGTANVGQVYAAFTNAGTLNELMAFNSTGGPYAVTNTGKINGSFTFSANNSGTLLDGYSFINRGTVGNEVKLETGDLVFSNYGKVGGRVSSYDGDIQILNFAGAFLNGGIQTAAGNDVVINTGTIKGNINLGTGTNSFVNFGLVESGATFSVGAGNSLENYGLISPGGWSNVQTTTFTGDFDQYASAAYLLTLQGASVADQIAVSGTAEIAGAVVVNRTGAIGNTGSAVIMTSGGSLTNTITSLTQNGWQYALSVVPGSAGGTTYYRYDLANCCGNYVLATPSMIGDGVSWSTRLYESDGSGGYNITSLTTLPTTGDQLVLSWNRLALMNYLSSVTLTDHEAEVAGILQGEESGSSAIRFLNDQLLDANTATAKYLIGSVLSPKAFVADYNSLWQSTNGFTQAVNSCPKLEGSPGLILEGECYWAKFGGRQTDWERTATNIGGQDQGYSFSGGVQVALRDEWRLGFAGSYETANLDTATGVNSDRDTFSGAIVLKNRWDNVSVAATGFAGYAWADTERKMFGLIGTAKSDREMWLAGANLRLSQLFDLPNRWYVKPMVDFNATHIATKDFSESGAIGANLAVEGDGTWALAASPAIEIGTEIRHDGIVYRPYVRAGGTFFDDATFDVTASFVAAPGQFFTATQEFDDRYVDVTVGLDILTADGVDLKLTYDGRYSDNSTMLSLGAKAAVPF